jgi:hypothetical protein
LELIIPIAIKNNSENAQDLVTQYINILSGGSKAEEFKESNEDILKKWVSTGSLNAVNTSSDAAVDKKYQWDMMVGESDLSQSMPKEWDQFVRAKFKDGRRNS